MKEITKQFLIANEFEDFNQVQKDVLAQVNLDRDLIVVAPTGTGKTHAFLFSVLEKLEVNQNNLQAIILSPTRELAMQTYDFAKIIYEVNKEVVIDLAIGGMDNKRLRKKLEHQPHILITTPGKLLDVLGWNVLRLDTIKQLIIDEMDMMFDYGFLGDITKISNFMMEDVQFLLLSATLPTGIEHFTKKYLINPVMIESTDDIFKPKIKHILIHRRHLSLEEGVLDVLTAINPSIVIIFSNTKDEVKSIAQYLREYGIDAVEIHGDLSSRERKQVVNRIRTQHLQYIVATDLAARGIDLPEISHVVNANIPNHDLSFYMHRAGRTGRSGRDGYCISLVDGKDEKSIRKLYKQDKINFEFKRVQKNALIDARSFFILENKNKGQLDPEISQKLSRKKVKVKPGYKKKHKAKVERLMRKKKRKIIEQDIKRQKKERAIRRQRQLNEGE